MAIDLVGFGGSGTHAFTRTHVNEEENFIYFKTDAGETIPSQLEVGSTFIYKLVTKGLAFAVAVPPNTRLARCLKQSEAAAQRQGVGIWSADVYPQALVDLDDDLGGLWYRWGLRWLLGER